MCNTECLDFVRRAVAKGDVTGKSVLEVGSFDVNGSPRHYLESLGPASYVGVDLREGPGVDLVCDASFLAARFGGEAFDLVVSTELLEHVRDWRLVIANFKRLVRPGGLIAITTRSPGFKPHDFPYDFWRFEPEDMRAIFADCDIERVETDASEPGVFLSARRPDDPTFAPLDLSDYAVFSMQSGQRTVVPDGSPQGDMEAAERLRAELRALRMTRTFRYSAWARCLYGRFRSMRTATRHL